MAGINKVFLVGRVGMIENKGNVVKASLATSEYYKDRHTGEKQENTEWHRLTFFGKLAEIAGKYVQKGDLLHIEGKIQYGKYTAQDGVERYTTDIIVRNMQNLTSKKDRVSAGNTPPPHPAVDQNNYATDDDFADDTIPF